MRDPLVSDPGELTEQPDDNHYVQIVDGRATQVEIAGHEAVLEVLVRRVIGEILHVHGKQRRETDGHFLIAGKLQTREYDHGDEAQVGCGQRDELDAW